MERQNRMLGYLKKIDVVVLKWINISFRNKTFDKIMPMITAAGNLGIVWIVIYVLLLTKSDYRLLGKMILASLLITTIVGEGVMKHLIRRKRPFHEDDEKELLITRPITYSFPSGHTASSFAVAAVFIKTNNSASLIIIILASLIAFSRVYLGVHYPSDVLGGGIIGFFCGLLTVMLFLGRML